jgi:hypothetical protein
MGIPNGLQNADRHDTLSASLQEDMSPSRRTRTQSFLGHQKVEHGPQGSRHKKKLKLLNLRSGGKRLTTVPSYIKKEPKDVTTRESRPCN